jgi:mannose-6-phosphate isomerase
MERLSGTFRDYAWGSTDAIPEILGVEPDGLPKAEYWLGAYEGSPSTLASGESLSDHLAEHPEELGEGCRRVFGDRLPFLLKILSAAEPLSLQAHPDCQDACDGFDLEQSAGTPPDDRTFIDDWPRPETLVALTEVEGLCGFRDPLETRALLDGLGVKDSLDDVFGPLTERAGSAGLAEVFLDCLTGDGRRLELVGEVVSAAVNHVEDAGELGLLSRTAVELDEYHPGDPSILAALLLNRVHLAPGQGLRVPPGTMHTYLRGTGIELAANSSNTVRGGLTDKHIDVDSLVRIVNFGSGPVERVEAVVEGVEGVEGAEGAEGSGVFREYPTRRPECRLWALRVRPGDAEMLPATDHPRILLVLDGHLVCSSAASTEEIVRGQSLWIPAGEQVQIQGNCDGYLASSGLETEWECDCR